MVVGQFGGTGILACVGWLYSASQKSAAGVPASETDRNVCSTKVKLTHYPKCPLLSRVERRLSDKCGRINGLRESNAKEMGHFRSSSVRAIAGNAPIEKQTQAKSGENRSGELERRFSRESRSSNLTEQSQRRDGQSWIQPPMRLMFSRP